MNAPSLMQLAEAAQLMPWDKSPADVPHADRAAFRDAMTADFFLELVKALQGVVRVADRATVEFDAARAAIAKATGGPRFADISCSHCAQSFGPGDAGFSHCDQHAHLVGRPA